MTSSHESAKQPNLQEIVTATHQEVKDAFLRAPMRLAQEETSYRGWEKADDGTELPIFDMQPYSTVGEIDGQQVANLLPAVAELLGVQDGTHVEIGYSDACFITDPQSVGMNTYQPEQSIFSIVTPHETDEGSFISYETIELNVDPHQQQLATWSRSVSSEDVPETVNLDLPPDELLGKIALGEKAKVEEKFKNGGASLSQMDGLREDEANRLQIAHRAGNDNLNFDEAQALAGIARLLPRSS